MVFSLRLLGDRSGRVEAYVYAKIQVTCSTGQANSRCKRWSAWAKTDAALQYDIRFGSKADMCTAKGHVRFTPKSGHVQRISRCPLRARSGHLATAIAKTRVEDIGAIISPERAQASFCDATTNSWKSIDPTYIAFSRPGSPGIGLYSNRWIIFEPVATRAR